MNQLEKEVAAVDEVIASLGDEGKALLAAIAATKATMAGLPADSRHVAAYIPTDNQFLFAAGGTLQAMFNYRVHEGVHACQFTQIPEFVGYMRNFEVLGKDPTRPVPSPEAFIGYMPVIEGKAHAVQAYFNLLAARQYNDPGFIAITKSTAFPPYLPDLQTKYFENGGAAKDLAREMALNLLDNEYDTGEVMEDAYHYLYLQTYANFAMLCPGPALQKLKLYDLAEGDMRKLAYAGGTFGFEEELLQKYPCPRLNAQNALNLIDIRSCLPR